jgi:hypothetical protein
MVSTVLVSTAFADSDSEKAQARKQEVSTNQERVPVFKDYTNKKMSILYQGTQLKDTQRERDKQMNYVLGLEHCRSLAKMAAKNSTGTLDGDAFVRECYAFEFMDIDRAMRERREGNG